MTEKITVQTLIGGPREKVWEFFTTPQHIMKWNTPSPDWHTTKAENDLRTGGTFISRMEAKDGSQGFDFGGTYGEVIPFEKITYTIGDGRKVDVLFSHEEGGTRIVETFEAETQNPIEMQRGGWQAILDNFKKYAEEYTS